MTINPHRKGLEDSKRIHGVPGAPNRSSLVVLLLLATTGLLAPACKCDPPTPQHRERAEARDTGCTETTKPSAYFYPADNRTDYRPDNPWADGCALLVADHLFCCPHAPRATDR